MKVIIASAEKNVQRPPRRLPSLEPPLKTQRPYVVIYYSNYVLQYYSSYYSKVFQKIEKC